MSIKVTYVSICLFIFLSFTNVSNEIIFCFNIMCNYKFSEIIKLLIFNFRTEIIRVIWFFFNIHCYVRWIHWRIFIICFKTIISQKNKKSNAKISIYYWITNLFSIKICCTISITYEIFNNLRNMINTTKTIRIYQWLFLTWKTTQCVPLFVYSSRFITYV